MVGAEYMDVSNGTIGYTNQTVVGTNGFNDWNPVHSVMVALDTENVRMLAFNQDDNGQYTCVGPCQNVPDYTVLAKTEKQALALGPDPAFC